MHEARSLRAVQRDLEGAHRLEALASRLCERLLGHPVLVVGERLVIRFAYGCVLGSEEHAPGQALDVAVLFHALDIDADLALRGDGNDRDVTRVAQVEAQGRGRLEARLVHVAGSQAPRAPLRGSPPASR